MKILFSMYLAGCFNYFSFRSLAEAQLKGPKGEPPPPKKKTNTGWTNWIWGASYFSGSSSTVSDDPQKRRQSLVLIRQSIW